ATAAARTAVNNQRRVAISQIPKPASPRRHLFTRVILPGCFLLATIATTVAQAPSLTQQPSDQTVFYGDPAMFTLHASGSLPISYQWFRNGSAISAATSNV